MANVLKSYGTAASDTLADSINGNYCPECGGRLFTFPVNTSPGDQLSDKSVNSLTKCLKYEKQNGFCDFEVENRGLRRYGQPYTD
jgi:hypothetical protein